MKKRLFSLFFSLLFCAGAAWHFAVAQPLLPEGPEPPTEPAPKPLVALIAAPKEVCLGNANGFTVRVVVQSNDGTPLPPRVRLRSGVPMACGEVFSTKGEIELPLTNGQASAELLFTSYGWTSREPFHLEVTTVDEPLTLLCVAQIKIRDVDSSEVIEVSKRLKADGKEKGVFKVRVKDQFGDPVPDYAGFALYQLPSGEKPEIIGRTDKSGVSTFEIPPMKRAGRGTAQFIAFWKSVTQQHFIEWTE